MGYTEKQKHYIAIFMQHVDIVLALLNRRKKTKFEEALNEANNVVKLASAALDFTTNVVSVSGIATAVPSAGMSLAVAGGAITALETGYAGYKLVQRYWNGDEKNPLSADEIVTAEKQLKLKIICREVADICASSRYCHSIEEMLDDAGIANFARYGASRTLKKIFEEERALANLNRLNAEFIANYLYESTRYPDVQISVLPAYQKTGNYYAKWAYSRPQAVSIDFSEKEPHYKIYSSPKEEESWPAAKTQNSTLAKYGYVLLPFTSLASYRKHRQAHKENANLSKITQQTMRPYYEISPKEVETYIEEVKNNPSLSFHAFLVDRLGLPVIAFCHDNRLNGLPLTSGDFSGVDFRRADLRGCTVNNTQWRGAKLDETRWGGEGDTLLAGSVFQGATAEGSQWNNVNFGGSDWSEALLNGAILDACSLGNMIFINSRWENALFKNMRRDDIFAAFLQCLNEEAQRRLNLEKKVNHLKDDVESVKSGISSLHSAHADLKQQFDTEAERQSEKARRKAEAKALFDRLQHPPTGELTHYVTDINTWLKMYARAQDISNHTLTDELTSFALESFNTVGTSAFSSVSIPTETDAKSPTLPLIDIHRFTLGMYAPLRFTRNNGYAWICEGGEAYFQAKALWQQFRETPAWVLPSSWMLGNFTPALRSFLAHFQTENDRQKLLFHWREHEASSNCIYQNIEDILNEHAEGSPHGLFLEREHYFARKAAEERSLNTHKTSEEIEAAWFRRERDVISLCESGVWEENPSSEIAIGPLSGLSPTLPPYHNNLPLQRKRSAWHRTGQYIADLFWQQLEQTLNSPSVNVGNVLALFPQCLERQLKQLEELKLEAQKNEDSTLQEVLQAQLQDIHKSKLFRMEILVMSIPRIKNAYQTIEDTQLSLMQEAMLLRQNKELIQWLTYQFDQAVPEEFIVQCRHATAAYFERGWKLWLRKARQEKAWQNTPKNKQQLIIQALEKQDWNGALTLFQGTSSEDWEDSFTRMIQEGRNAGFARYLEQSSEGFKNAWQECTKKEQDSYVRCAEEIGFKKLKRDLRGLYLDWPVKEQLDLNDALIEGMKTSFHAWIETDKIKPYWSTLSLAEKSICQQALASDDIPQLKAKLNTIFSAPTLQKNLIDNMYQAFKDVLFPVLNRFADVRMAWATFSAEEQDNLIKSCFQGKWNHFLTRIEGYLFRPTSQLLEHFLDIGLHPDACHSQKPLLAYAIESACNVALNMIPEGYAFVSELPNNKTLYLYPPSTEESITCRLKTPHGVYWTDYSGPDIALIHTQIATQQAIPLETQRTLIQYVEETSLAELERRLELVYYLLDSGVVTGSIFSSNEATLSHLFKRAYQSWEQASETEKPLWAKLGKVLNWFATLWENPTQTATMSQHAQQFQESIERYWAQFVKENQSYFSWRGRNRGTELHTQRQQHHAIFTAMGKNIPQHMSHFYDYCAKIQEMISHSPRAAWNFGLFQVQSPFKGRLVNHAQAFLKEATPVMHGSGKEAGLIKWGDEKTTQMTPHAFPNQGLVAVGSSFLPAYYGRKMDLVVRFEPDTALQLARTQQALEDTTQELEETKQALKQSEEAKRELAEQLALVGRKPDNKEEKKPSPKPGFF